MVSGLRTETSMMSWREAGEPMRVLGGGGCGHAAYRGHRDWDLGLVRPWG